MSKPFQFVVVSVLSASLSGLTGLAQDHHDDHPADPHGAPHYVRHDEWKKGYHLNQADWGRGEHIDYRTYHLNAPPHGYEWRAIDGNYVLAAVSTGIVASVVVASTIR